MASDEGATMASPVPPTAKEFAKSFVDAPADQKLLDFAGITMDDLKAIKSTAYALLQDHAEVDAKLMGHQATTLYKQLIPTVLRDHEHLFRDEFDNDDKNNLCKGILKMIQTARRRKAKGKMKLDTPSPGGRRSRTPSKRRLSNAGSTAESNVASEKSALSSDWNYQVSYSDRHAFGESTIMVRTYQDDARIEYLTISLLLKPAYEDLLMSLIQPRHLDFEKFKANLRTAQMFDEENEVLTWSADFDTTNVINHDFQWQTALCDQWKQGVQRIPFSIALRQRRTAADDPEERQDVPEGAHEEPTSSARSSDSRVSSPATQPSVLKDSPSLRGERLMPTIEGPPASPKLPLRVGVRGASASFSRQKSPTAEGRRRATMTPSIKPKVSGNGSSQQRSDWQRSDWQGKGAAPVPSQASLSTSGPGLAGHPRTAVSDISKGTAQRSSSNGM